MLLNNVSRRLNLRLKWSWLKNCSEKQTNSCKNENMVNDRCPDCSSLWDWDKVPCWAKNASDMMETISNLKNVLFVMTNSKKCAELLPYGPSTIIDNDYFYGRTQSPYFSTAVRKAKHDTWTQRICPYGYGYYNKESDKDVMIITWKFDTVKTVEDRFPRLWNQVRESSGQFNSIAAAAKQSPNLKIGMQKVLGEVLPDERSMVILMFQMTSTGKAIGIHATIGAMVFGWMAFTQNAIKYKCLCMCRW